MTTWTCCLALIFLHVPRAMGGEYWKVDFCPATDILTSVDTLLMLDCIQLCHNHTQCKMFTRENVTCDLYPQPINDQCHQGPQLTKYFVQQDVLCMNGGFMSSDGHCVCVQGFVGANCSARMMSCSEGYLSGQYDGFDGVLPVHPASSSTPFYVHCDMVNGGRLYVQFREDPATDLYRNWDETSGGFGILIGDHWLGNRYLHHLLASRNMALTVQYVIFNGTEFTRNYTDLKIKNEAGDFAILSYTSTSGDLGGDCLSGLIGAPFSASNRDIDNLAWWSCALEHGGAWWFDVCEVQQFNYLGTPALCNPNGQVIYTADGLRTNDSKETFWVDFPFAVYKTYIWLTDTPSV